MEGNRREQFRPQRPVQGFVDVEGAGTSQRRSGFLFLTAVVAHDLLVPVDIERRNEQYQVEEAYREGSGEKSQLSTKGLNDHEHDERETDR